MDKVTSDLVKHLRTPTTQHSELLWYFVQSIVIAYFRHIQIIVHEKTAKSPLLPIAYRTFGGCLCTNVGSAYCRKNHADPKWMGTSPSDISWSEDSKVIYFKWNPDKNKADSLYSIAIREQTIKKVDPAFRRSLPAQGVYTHSRTQKVFARNGDIFWLDIKSGKIRQLTNTTDPETSPSFSRDEQKVVFMQGDNVYTWQLQTGELTQVTNFKKGSKKTEPKDSEQDKWLKADQLRTSEIVKERTANWKATEKQQKNDQPKRVKEIYLDEKNLSGVLLSPDERFVTYRLSQAAKGVKTAVVPSYVTESGYTEDLLARTKVGNAQAASELWVYDRQKDTTWAVATKDIPGITDEPDYRKDYPQKAANAKKDSAATKKPAARPVIFHGPYWSEDGKQAVMVIRSLDNKDRWIMKFDPATGTLRLLNRQRDEAWIGGPGIGAYPGFAGDMGWLADNQTFWFESEETGYAHLYTINVVSGQKKQLTSGKFEVSDVMLSKDKQQFYYLSNEVHPGEKHLYRLPVTGGKPTRLTTGIGAYEYTLSPDEKNIALRYSYLNKPWELYVMENKAGAKTRQLTQSVSREFTSYAWREPEVISFKARDGAEVYARLYQPENGKKNGAAVVFVHGAGYLQNAHKWWSQYFREYLFHNLLADQGYTVLDIDYRGSAGYGRDWRTGIYRHMGGKDLTDHVDGAKWLTEKYGVQANRIGIYGGSYGGFITLMALFTEPDVFAAGAALRSVTDWAHYNHPYTSNILNEPFTDSLAYARSSPIYFAEGLKKPLLMCHGMVDVNVHFQDIVRLSQRLIELKKENWELAVYPMEDHGFVEPSSWTDEYKRILKLFETHLREGAK
jgi:dipeptidyl aminopeptidase/acylaminoacyl peptidase